MQDQVNASQRVVPNPAVFSKSFLTAVFTSANGRPSAMSERLAKLAPDARF